MRPLAFALSLALCALTVAAWVNLIASVTASRAAELASMEQSL